MAVITRHGDRAMDFVWLPKGALTVSTVLAAFLADPEPFLAGSRRLVEDAVLTAARPVADSLGGATDRLVFLVRRIGTLSLVLLAVIGLGTFVRNLRPKATR
jgi:hypothetical protein